MLLRRLCGAGLKNEKISNFYIVAIIVEFVKKNEKMEYSPQNFLNVNKLDQNEYIIISSDEFTIVPPLSVVKQKGYEMKSFDYSKVDINNFPKIKELVFYNHFVECLLNNVYQANQLESIQIKYCTNVDFEKEIKKILKIKILKILDFPSH
ncbi:hypothetical protein M0M57_07670 [Flavobacterium azooxidireducens]|uniref:Uncharacterized protein n=1 Tax=Flavobacterium azooxidireducens TaxID=1871076 RepID=A0ABY4KLZ6_9FLAO|nr:hypothetical protein [Flavobacterium azooxidireducens]UPQ80708.1 hypothetical protein M0M57_07670 [Flavobacterium azooxidireducens]